MRKNTYYQNFGLSDRTKLPSFENSCLMLSLDIMYVFMSHQQFVGKNHNIKIANKYAKIAAYFKYLRRALTIKTVCTMKLGEEHIQQNLATIQFTMNCLFPIQKHKD